MRQKHPGAVAKSVVGLARRRSRAGNKVVVVVGWLGPAALWAPAWLKEGAARPGLLVLARGLARVYLEESCHGGGSGYGRRSLEIAGAIEGMSRHHF